MATKQKRQTDPGLDAIADLERRIVEAHDEKMHFHGVSAEEAARLRPDVERLAATVAAGLRAEHESRHPR